MRWIGIVCWVAATAPALANDTSAVIGAGGLEFVSNNSIAMASEELFISAEEIRVVYQFRNDGDVDQDVLVAFPMPDIAADPWSPVAFPDGPEDNPFRFETTFDGVPVEAELHEYAFAAGVDRTDYLRKRGIPLLPFGETATEAVDELDEATTAEMLHLGLLVPDEFDAGKGWELHHRPYWTWRAAYTWEATFPARATVEVVHRYKPSVGGTAGISFLNEAGGNYNPAAEYERKYCVDEAFRNAVLKTAKPGEPWTAPFTERWISYIVSTGSNWAGGAIERFRLVVDKGAPENLVSFCGTDVRKIGPTTFEMEASNYWPQRELDILILQRHEAQP
ncbi:MULTISPECIES: DUF4424 domain-containing protein [unclassified Devosia]|jgi:hypothetical protein|uniref:DUF4424 domain-containing protein n=1 Tax=unclassified Devosia TaxID=196773 RepID=UPI000FDCD754|nr:MULTISPECIES: DUF4424 domain-containing protein [unclassified Devosia]